MAKSRKGSRTSRRGPSSGGRGTGPKFSFEDSKIKQGVGRDLVFNYFKARHKDCNGHYKALTLPGPTGLVEPSSVENKFLKEFPNGKLLVVERNRKRVDLLRIQIRRHLASNQITLIHQDLDGVVSDLADGVSTFDLGSGFDLFYADWMDGLTLEKLTTISRVGESLLKRRALFACTNILAGSRRPFNHMFGIRTNQPGAKRLMRRAIEDAILATLEAHTSISSPDSFTNEYRNVSPGRTNGGIPSMGITICQLL